VVNCAVSPLHNLSASRELHPHFIDKDMEGTGVTELKSGQVWWCLPVIPVLGRGRQEDYSLRPVLN
jgi:hypothetical protein